MWYVVGKSFSYFFDQFVVKQIGFRDCKVPAACLRAAG